MKTVISCKKVVRWLALSMSCVGCMCVHMGVYMYVCVHACVAVHVFTINNKYVDKVI